MVNIDKRELNKFKEFVKASYPNECCGFLIGEELDKVYIYKIFIPDDQELESSPDHIDISEDWWEDAEHEAENEGLGIVGFIHSHPDYSDVSLSEQDLALTDFFKEELKDIVNPIMGVVGIWRTKKGFRTRVGLWPMFNKLPIELN